MTRTDILGMIADGTLDTEEAARAALKYLSTDDRDDLAIVNGWDDFDIDDVYDLLDDGILDASEILNAVLQYLSTDDVADLAVTNGWDDDIFNEDIGEPEDEKGEVFAEDNIEGVGSYVAYIPESYDKYILELTSIDGRTKEVELDIDLNTLQLIDAAEDELHKAFDLNYESDEDENSYDPDEEEARKFMPGGEYDESDSDAVEGGDPDADEARKFMPGGEYDEDVYYDPVDGYRDTEGFHNSVEEAEDDYYENDYKVNIPEDDE